MNRLYLLALFIAIAGFSGASTPTEIATPYEYKRHIIENLNEKLRQKNAIRINSLEQLQDIDPNALIDEVCRMLDQVIVDENLDPFEVYKGTILGVDLDVWIGGYSSMARQGDASLITAPGTVDVSSMASMVNLAGNISFSLNFFGIEINAGANAQIESVSFKIALRFLYGMNNGTLVITPYVDDFQISEIGTITVQVFGLGILNPFANIIADLIANLIKYLIPILLNGIIEDVLQQILDYIFGVPT